MHSLTALGGTIVQEFSTIQTTLRLAAITLLAAGFAGCSTTTKMIEPQDAPPANPVDVSAIPDAVPRAEPLSRYGNPESYVVYGQRYYTLPSSKGYRERGMASWYGTKFHGKRTSSGEPYDLYGMTADRFMTTGSSICPTARRPSWASWATVPARWR